jgi:hypothetical protein
MLTPIAISRDIEVDTPALAAEYVEAVFERFEPGDYGGWQVEVLTDIPDEDPLVFQLGYVTLPETPPR